MHGVIAVTDFGWYEHLVAQPKLDEVNFWRPSGRAFKALPVGGLFFFKLKARYGHAIVGFGRFARFAQLPWWLAWSSFGVGNGVTNEATFHQRLRKIRTRNRIPDTQDIRIGCIMLCEPVFFPPDMWVTGPADWKPRTVSFERYDLTADEGQRVYLECLLRAIELGARRNQTETDIRHRYGKPTEVKPRLGQGTFRVAVTDAYQGQCAVTTEHSLPALEAAHIRPYADDGEHDVSNGLLLRSDVHRLYDRGYVTVTPDLRFVVSDHLLGHFGNGAAYRQHHGKLILEPNNAWERPDPVALRWHNENCFEAFV